MATWWLHHLRDGATIQTLEVRELPFFLGTDPACDLVLAGDWFQPRHAAIVPRGGGACLETLERGDLVPLEPGTSVKFGTDTLLFFPATAATQSREAPDQVNAILNLLEALMTPRSHPMDEAAVLKALVRALVEGFGAEWGAVVRAAESGEVLACAGRRIGLDPGRVSRTVLGRLADSESPAIVSSVAEDSELEAAFSIPAEVRSVVAAELRVGEHLEGVVYLESRASKRTFSADERAILTRVCALAADRMAKHREARDLREQGERLLEVHRLAVRQGFHIDDIVGESEPMAAIRRQLDQVATTGVTGLLQGESGTGKDLIARAIHARSPRADAPFVAVNCAALSPDLAESELFGHAKGAFTGASQDRVGRMELAQGGVLFLDEVGELAPAVQAKLLRALEDQTIQRLGEAQSRPLDIQLLASTNTDLKVRVSEGLFREDLFYRLAVYLIAIPPLRDRPGDLPLLVKHFLQESARRYRREIRGISKDALKALASYRWPGNVRELQNLMTQAVIREDSSRIELESFTLPEVLGATRGAPAPREPEDFQIFTEARADWERSFLMAALRAHGGDAPATYKRLGMSRATFYRACKQRGIGSHQG